MNEVIENNEGGQYGKYIVQELHQPATFLSATTRIPRALQEIL